MLYLPRLYVYHAGVKEGSEQSETFKAMENRLLRFIMNPAMIATWLFGVMMITANPDLFSMGWMHIKFTAVILMTVIHMIYARWRRKFAVGENSHTGKYYKIWNEIPTLLLIVIVIMAITKPF
jgi:putative membrane protein